MEEIDWDAISIPAEPYFMPVDSDAETELHEDDTITLGMSDSISLSETKSFTTFTSEGKKFWLKKFILLIFSTKKGAIILTLKILFF